MLTEKHIAVVSLLLAIAGTGLLFLFNQAIDPMEIEIGEITKSNIGERIKVGAKIEWALEKDNYILLTLDDGSKIKAVHFGPSPEERQIAKPGSFVAVVGKVQLYKNELEIIAEEIKRW
jgi:DNA/RNA endonuclease YhcR with UshA esterase domain